MPRQQETTTITWGAFDYYSADSSKKLVIINKMKLIST
jgi:hypothetical protein